MTAGRGRNLASDAADSPELTAQLRVGEAKHLNELISISCFFADRHFQRALELDPNLAPTYQGLGAAYRFVGELDLAVSAYTRAYELRDRIPPDHLV